MKTLAIFSNYVKLSVRSRGRFLAETSAKLKCTERSIQNYISGNRSVKNPATVTYLTQLLLQYQQAEDEQTEVVIHHGNVSETKDKPPPITNAIAKGKYFDQYQPIYQTTKELKQLIAQMSA
jgi:hypothetical protein